MSNAPPDPIAAECRAARRLGLLFRAERAGQFDRRRPETVRRLRARRAALIAALESLEQQRRAAALPPSLAPPPALTAALRLLAGEVAASRDVAERGLEWLGAELRLRRGEGRPSGVRAGAAGPVLGRG